MSGLRRRLTRAQERAVVERFVLRNHIKAKKAPPPRPRGARSADGWSLSDALDEVDWIAARSFLVDKFQSGRRQGMR